MTTKWSHLPNAKYIDLVIASLKANPEQWTAAHEAVQDSVWCVSWDATVGDVARDAARAVSDAARNAARNAAWDAARIAARNAAYYAARAAILALIAYDDCAHMLDSDPDDLRVLSKLGSHAATLIIPASIAFKLIREKHTINI